MPIFKNLFLLALSSSLVLGLGTRQVPLETRTLDQIYAAALKEGGTVTLWHGGDEKNQQDSLKKAFETRFPGMTLNVTVDLSKYHDVNVDQMLAQNDVYVDSVLLQTLHDFPRWKAQGSLLDYKPLGFNEIYNEFKDPAGSYMGFFIVGWSNVWNTNFLSDAQAPKEYTDYLKPEFKDKLVLTYPNDDDAVLYQFDLIIKKYGWGWFDALLAQNPRWVRGTQTPTTLMATSNGKYTASFSTGIGLNAFPPFGLSFPTKSSFVTWPQNGAILKKAPHPEGAKLLHSWALSLERQNGRWSVRRDATAPAGYPPIMEMPNTDPTQFGLFMANRAAVERLRFLFEDKIGTAQGLSPLDDAL